MMLSNPVLIIDFEMTCSDDGSIAAEDMEVIEIGACWASPEGIVLDQFETYVRPTQRPHLTWFCTQLTGIAQQDVDNASTFSLAAMALASFAKRHQGAVWASWGASDRKQIDQECLRQGISQPMEHMVHENLKKTFARSRKIKQVGMGTALTIVGLKREGEAHRALSDALNIARLLPHCLGRQSE